MSFVISLILEGFEVVMLQIIEKIFCTKNFTVKLVIIFQVVLFAKIAISNAFFLPLPLQLLVLLLLLPNIGLSDVLNNFGIKIKFSELNFKKL